MESVPYKKIVQEMLKEGVKFNISTKDLEIIETSYELYYNDKLVSEMIQNNILLDKDAYEKLMPGVICYNKDEGLYIPAPVIQLIDVNREKDIINLLKVHEGCYDEEKFEESCAEIDRKYKSILEFRMQEYKEFRNILKTYEDNPEYDMDENEVEHLERFMKSLMEQ